MGSVPDGGRGGGILKLENGCFDGESFDEDFHIPVIFSLASSRESTGGRGVACDHNDHSV